MLVGSLPKAIFFSELSVETVSVSVNGTLISFHSGDPVMFHDNNSVYFHRTLTSGYTIHPTSDSVPRLVYSGDLE